MFTRIDHVVIGVPSVADAIATYTRLGFNVVPASTQAGLDPECAFAFLGAQYLEFVPVGDAAGGGIRAIALGCDDLAIEVAAMRARGVEVSEPAALERVLPDGRHLRDLVATPVGLPLRFVEDAGTRAPGEPVPAWAAHQNGAVAFESLYVVGVDLEDLVARYRSALGVAESRRYTGIIIMAEMAVWDFGPSQLFLAQPTAAGPAQSALDSHGEGAFQVIFHTTSTDLTAALLAARDITPVANARRSTGEITVVIGASDALGSNIGFVGPES